MNISGNTILVTGGGSGIGRALAEALHAAGNQVIIAGRRKDVLDATTAANPGMLSAVFDISDAASIQAFAATLLHNHPTLNAVLNNAGIMKFESVLGGPDTLAIAESTIATNLLGPIRLLNALLPHLKAQPHAAILNVTSGLAFVPLAGAPTYCATKAALHSYTESLRYQLKDTAVEVIEIAPPYVQTELGGQQQASDPRAMPLDAYISETVGLLHTQPTPPELNVKNVYPLRFAAEKGSYDKTFQFLNDSFATH